MTCSCGLPLVLTFCPWCAGFEDLLDPMDPTAQRRAPGAVNGRPSGSPCAELHALIGVGAGLLPQPLHAAVEQAVRTAADEAQTAGRCED